MPELPEVETMVRGIRSTVEGRRIERLARCPCERKPLKVSPTWRTFRRKVVNRVVESVTRRAKRVVLRLDDGNRIVIEPRMTGLMLLTDPPSKDHLRFRWDFDDGKSLWYWDRRGLGTMRLLTPQDYQSRVENKLGPDALAMTTADWEAICRTARPIKVLLLDQSKVAGIGNLYASEILHRSRIHPATISERLSPSDRDRMAEATREILETAIRYEGSTLNDGTYRNALNGSGGYQNEHRVYAREHEPCEVCGASIVRIVQAQRATFFCPGCQPSAVSVTHGSLQKH